MLRCWLYWNASNKLAISSYAAPIRPARCLRIRSITLGAVRERAGIPEGRLHDFQHTIGIYGAGTGANAFLVRDLLGHKTISMTARYVKRYADPVRAVANKVSSRIAAAMNSGIASI